MPAVAAAARGPERPGVVESAGDAGRRSAAGGRAAARRRPRCWSPVPPAATCNVSSSWPATARAVPIVGSVRVALPARVVAAVPAGHLLAARGAAQSSSTAISRSRRRRGPDWKPRSSRSSAISIRARCRPRRCRTWPNWLDLQLDGSLTADQHRQLLQALPGLWRRWGTVAGLRDWVRVHLAVLSGLDVEVIDESGLPGIVERSSSAGT